MFADSPPIYLNNGNPSSLAEALAIAKETPKIELAPKFDLLGVPSKSIIILSICFCSETSIPIKLFEIILFTFFIALETPFPRYDLPPSLNYTASCSPVDAPEGTAALPKKPF